MNIGDLKHRITFQQIITTINDNGYEIQTWQDHKTVWASINNLFGREFFQAQSVQAEKTVKFIIRYCKDINENMTILFDGKRYNITFIDNIKYRNKFLEIKALQVTQNG